jgi:hypothetical protein
MEKNEKAIKQISFSHKSKCITSSQCYDLAFFHLKKLPLFSFSWLIFFVLPVPTILYLVSLSQSRSSKRDQHFSAPAANQGFS